MAPTVEELRKDFAKLLDPAEPLDSRMRELYRLKESYIKTSAGVAILVEAIDTTDSVLLQHELAYNVGQSGLEEAVAPLEKVVRDKKYDIVTRHEAAEALGALGSPLAMRVLDEYCDPANEPEAAIRESCELALARIAIRAKKGDKAVQPPADCMFVSIDPMPAFSELNLAEAGTSTMPKTVPELEAILLDTSGKTRLSTRYMAMFSLRNIGNDAAIAALGRALREDTTSPLFRHEVAFVLGQLERPSSQPALIEALRDENEAPMVRHEAAEALGAIADPKTLPVLAEYAQHSEPIVRDSCIVAIEMHKYWSQYNSLGKPEEGNHNRSAVKPTTTTTPASA